MSANKSLNNRPKLSKTQLTGQSGEQMARQYLEHKGYIFLTANWRCKMGEIDLIMQDKQTRVLVEVRLRHRTRFAAAAETIAWQKQQKLIRAARFYQQKEDYWGDLRFDVVAIMVTADGTNSIEHIPYAFTV